MEDPRVWDDPTIGIPIIERGILLVMDDPKFMDDSTFANESQYNEMPTSTRL